MLELMLLSNLKKLKIDPGVFEKLVASDGAANDQFGYSVAISGDGSTVVVGAYQDDDKGNNSGSVYIFTKQANGTYLQTQKLLASDGADGDNFGISVAVSVDGSTVVVGAYQDDDKGADSGSAYIFTKQANGSYLQTQKLLAADGAAGDTLGRSVAVSADGSTVVVGAEGDDDKGNNSGSVYIFTKQANGSYLQVQKLVASDGSMHGWFGASVAVSGDGSTVVVGAYGDDDKGGQSGSAYIFTKQANGSYLQTQKLLASDGEAGDYFGWCVAVSADGSTVVVGTPRDGDKGSYSGSAYIFTKQSNGIYTQLQKLVPADGAAGDWFGYSVAISTDGSTIVIGAYGDDDKGSASGSAYVFTKEANGSYVQTHKLVAIDGEVLTYFGYSVAISNTSVVVGAYRHLGKGAAYIY